MQRVGIGILCSSQSKQSIPPSCLLPPTISFHTSSRSLSTDGRVDGLKMPSSALNPAPTLADIQNRQSAAAVSTATATPQHPAFGDSALRRRRAHSHSSHGSDSSHSSHSSYAARHPDRVPQKAASPNRAFVSVLLILGLFLFYTVAGLWLFVKGFLLTRHELTRVNTCDKPLVKDWSLPSPPAKFDDASLLSGRYGAQPQCRWKRGMQACTNAQEGGGADH